MSAGQIPDSDVNSCDRMSCAATEVRPWEVTRKSNRPPGRPGDPNTSGSGGPDELRSAGDGGGRDVGRDERRHLAADGGVVVVAPRPHY